MLVIDDKGDTWHKFPHIFVDFDSKTGPIAGSYEYLETGEKRSISLKDYKRVNIFPKPFPEPITGTIHEEKGVTLSDPDFSMLKHGNEMLYALYECDGRYSFLKPKDLVRIENVDTESSSKYYLRITYIESLRLDKYIKKYPESKWMIERQIGENPDVKKILNVYEFKKMYDFVVEREKAKTEKK